MRKNPHVRILREKFKEQHLSTVPKSCPIYIYIYMMCINNSLILHIYIIVRKHYHTYFELIHVFYIWFWSNAE